MGGGLAAQDLELLQQLRALVFPGQHVSVRPAAEVAPENQRRDGDRQPKSGVVERHRNAVGELRRVGNGTDAGLRAENFNHADYGPQQTQQWRNRGDGSQRRQKFIKPLRRLLACALHGLAQVIVAAVRVGAQKAQGAGQYRSQQ